MLKDAGYEVIVYFYNPNIFPQEEYNKRLEAEKTLCENLGVELILEDYNPDEFFNEVKGLENEPEKGKRCDVCFKLRLSKTAQKAHELGIEEFTTTISVSPHKDFIRVSSAGKAAAQELNLVFNDENFKKKDGFLKTNAIAKEMNLYRQNYCGCKFSMNAHKAVATNIS